MIPQNYVFSLTAEPKLLISLMLGAMCSKVFA